MPDKDLNYYMSLNYSIDIKKIEDESGTYYLAKVLELDGCQTTADTIEEVLYELEQVKREYIEIKLQHGDPVPEPKRTE